MGCVSEVTIEAMLLTPQTRPSGWPDEPHKERVMSSPANAVESQQHVHKMLSMATLLSPDPLAMDCRTYCQYPDSLPISGQ